MLSHPLTQADIPGPALLSSTTENSTARGPTPARSPAPPQIPSTSKADYSAFSSFTSPSPAPQSSKPQPSLLQQEQATQASKPQAPTSDPFAALTSPVRQSTPQQPQSTASLFDFGPTPASNPGPAPAATADDDEWAFSSALPDEKPASNIILVSETQLSISLHAYRKPNESGDLITLELKFSNKTDQPISELTFMGAVTKVYWTMSSLH